MTWPVTALPQAGPIRYATRRWFHGRLPQLAVRLWCRVVGHDWRDWHYDWPESIETEGLDKDTIAWLEFGPSDEEPLYWFRGCRRMCGAVQDARGTIRQREELPL